jgi:hypothetical protein
MGIFQPLFLGLYNLSNNPKEGVNIRVVSWCDTKTILAPLDDPLTDSSNKTKHP